MDSGLVLFCDGCEKGNRRPLMPLILVELYWPQNEKFVAECIQYSLDMDLHRRALVKIGLINDTLSSMPE